MNHTLWQKLMGRMTFRDKMRAVDLLYLVGALLLFFAFFHEEYRSLRSIDAQIAGNQLERPLRQLLEYLPEHDLLSQRLLTGDELAKSDLNGLDAKITEQFRRLAYLDEVYGSPVEKRELGISEEDAERLSPANLSKTWDAIKRQIFDLTPAGSASLHAGLIHSVKELIFAIGDNSRLLLNDGMRSFYAMETTLINLPAAQELINQVVILSNQGIQKGELSEEKRGELTEALTLLNSTVEAARFKIGKIYKTEAKRGLNPNIIYLFNAFVDDVETLIRFTKSKILTQPKIQTTLEEFFSVVSEARNASFLFWDQAIDQLDDTLKALKKETWERLLFFTLVPLLLFCIGFTLAHLFVHYTDTDLKKLKEGITRFKEGDLTSRVHVRYEDETGRLSHTFNLMAAHFENVIGELNHLLEAIKKIASGDFSFRLAVKEPNSDIGLVLTSFNQMVQTFSEIVGQLRELGINLASSATQITAASKQQEVVITEQEATTREISVTANEISTTAKEFANTMNEVSRVAEQTAGLAQGGKESLNHMEGTMRQMVDASKNIASKLAILNEKAGNITSVITTITKVADQTNLLSLNASIEAEKAGEYGKSFAVIAREIRRLADLTAFATLDIEKIVSEIMSAVSTSVMGVDDFTQEIKNGVHEVSKVSHQLATIIEQVQVLNTRFESVNQGMQAQAVGAEQINDAIADLNQIAKETSSSLSGFRQTLQQLTIAASDLKNGVDFFCRQY